MGGKSKIERAAVGCMKVLKDRWGGGRHLECLWAAPYGRGCYMRDGMCYLLKRGWGYRES
jgi:hypothetical protein